MQQCTGLEVKTKSSKKLYIYFSQKHKDVFLMIRKEYFCQVSINILEATPRRPEKRSMFDI